MHAEVTGGQVNEAKVFVRVFRATEAALADERGSPPSLPAKLAGDKAYRSETIDRTLLARGVTPVIPSRAGERPERRAVSFDQDAYRGRNVIERLVGRLKEFRRIATRYEKKATHYAAMLTLAMIVIYLRYLAS